MLKKQVTYKDFNGVEQTDTCYFHLSQVEVIEMEAGAEGGMEAQLKRIVESNDQAAIVAKFKEIILAAYGVKSEDGKRFIKNDELREEFSQSQAFVEVYVEIATDADKAAAFINGVIPQAK